MKEEEKDVKYRFYYADYVDKNYIEKDKIRELLNKDVGQYMNFYRDIEQLLEE